MSKKIFYGIAFSLLLSLFGSLEPRAATFESSNSAALYNGKNEASQVFNYKNKRIYLSDDDINLMAQVVFAESRAEPYEGKVAVASVILNRLLHPGFPKTVSGVIMQKGAFSCVVNGKLNVVPTEECYNAVFDALKGKDPTGEAVFFYNPKTAKSQWMKNVKKSNVKPIGNHVFFFVQK
ncbi:MAG: cell wall hydrolase [Bacillota bacterium]|nr:cell wall hydrolase [Bacillota bacterium]